MDPWTQTPLCKTCFPCQVLLGLFKQEGAKDNLRHRENVLVISWHVSVYSQGAKNLLDSFSAGMKDWSQSKGPVAARGLQIYLTLRDSPSAPQRRMSLVSVRWANHKTLFPLDLNWGDFWNSHSYFVCQPRKQHWKQQAICQTSKENILVSRWLESNIMLVNNQIPVWHISPWTLTENYWRPFCELWSGSPSF